MSGAVTGSRPRIEPGAGSSPGRRGATVVIQAVRLCRRAVLWAGSIDSRSATIREHEGVHHARNPPAPEIEERLEKLAKRTGRTKSFYAREAILEYLDDLEDLYLAEKRYDDILKGRSKTVPLEEVVRRYGLED